MVVYSTEPRIMEDLKDIDIIVATRIDNHERAMNAFLTYRFFKEHTINSKFILINMVISKIRMHPNKPGLLPGKSFLEKADHTI